MAAVWILVPWVAPAPLAAADTPVQQQIDFGADMARRGLWKEALFRFQQADQLDPDNPRILNNIAVSFEALGMFDQALETYQKALRAGPDDRELRGNYSRFAEFYQSFRPREPGAETAADGSPGEPSPDGVSPDPGEATPFESDPFEPDPFEPDEDELGAAVAAIGDETGPGAGEER